jgi:hypothetical protein
MTIGAFVRGYDATQRIFVTFYSKVILNLRQFHHLTTLCLRVQYKYLQVQNYSSKVALQASAILELVVIRCTSTSIRLSFCNGTNACSPCTPSRCPLLLLKTELYYAFAKCEMK